jgi:hypothetical protein
LTACIGTKYLNGIVDDAPVESGVKPAIADEVIE